MNEQANTAKKKRIALMLFTRSSLTLQNIN